MRPIAFSAIVIAMIGSVAATVNLGACPYSKLVQWSFDDYDELTGIAKTYGYHHKISGMDQGFQNIIESLYSLGFKAPFDYQCDDLAAIEPWAAIAKEQFDTAEGISSSQTYFNEVNFCYFDSDSFETVFSSREDAFHRLVYVDEDYWTAPEKLEYHYLCGDTA
jgi:hypothetical protein